MPESMQVINQTVQAITEAPVDFEKLVRRQDDLEHEIKRLKTLISSMETSNKKTIDRIHKRINGLETEMAEVRNTLNVLVASMETVKTSVESVHKDVGNINAKQDVAISAQDKFISQLWKALFTVLGFVSIIITSLFALLK